MLKNKTSQKKIIKLLSFWIPISPLRRFFRGVLYNKFNNNTIYLIDRNGNQKKVFKIKGLVINIRGKNNKIIIGKPHRFKNSYIEILGNNNTVKIGIPNAKVECSIYLNGAHTNNTTLSIGDNFSIQSGNIVCRGENKRIIIGNNCMFSNNITIRNTDSHRIFDIETNEVLNPVENVIIGNKVWLTQDVTIGKGSIIPDGCIVGTKSFVNKKFEEPNCILAGIPAKIVRKNVKWEG